MPPLLYKIQLFGLRVIRSFYGLTKFRLALVAKLSPSYAGLSTFCTTQRLFGILLAIEKAGRNHNSHVDFSLSIKMFRLKWFDRIFPCSLSLERHTMKFSLPCQHFFKNYFQCSIQSNSSYLYARFHWASLQASSNPSGSNPTSPC